MGRINSGTVAALTLGCKVNTYDTESILTRFRNAGYAIREFNDTADIYIVNTCTVTAASDRKSRQMIRRAAGKGGIVVVTGCFAQNQAEAAAAIPGVHIVAGIKERGNIVDLVEDYHENYRETGRVISRVSGYNNDKPTFDNMPVTGLTNRTRAFIKIQEGCGNFCAYCVIPFARGPVRSRRVKDIASEVNECAKNGAREVVLTGICAQSYGADLDGDTLSDVLYAAAEAPGIERVRVSSVGPSAVTPAFIQAFAERKSLCGHVHLSLQAGCNATLARMNRRYTTDEYAGAVAAIRGVRPDAAITTDIITGFPGETDEDFDESLAFVEAIAFADLHVFPFSRREGTAAYNMQGQIPKHIKASRAARMTALGKRLREGFIAGNLDKTRRVLFETRREDGRYSGLTPNYIEVSVNSERDIRGMICPVLLECVTENGVYGTLI